MHEPEVLTFADDAAKQVATAEANPGKLTAAAQIAEAELVPTVITRLTEGAEQFAEAVLDPEVIALLIEEAEQIAEAATILGALDDNAVHVATATHEPVVTTL